MTPADNRSGGRYVLDPVLTRSAMKDSNVV